MNSKVQSNKFRQSGVTVLISTFNRSKYLRECIDSVLSQTLAPDQIIVVDDGSSDDTREVLSTYKSQIEVIHQENSGKASAINRAYRLAVGEFLWIFDDDDVACPDFIERNVNALVLNPECGFTYGDYLRGEDGTSSKIKVVGKSGVPVVDQDRFLISLLERCFLTTQSMLIRRNALKRDYVFDDRLVRSQDYELFVWLARFNASVRVEGPAYVRRYHSGLRGSNSDRFHSSQLEHKWYEYEKIAVAAFIDNAALEEYLPLSLQPRACDPEVKRLALIQKAVILSRKGLWGQLIETLKQISCLASADEPGLRTHSVSIGAFRKDLAVQELVRNVLVRKRVIDAVRNCGDVEVISCFARGLWYEKSIKDSCLSASERRSAAQTVIKMLGPKGLGYELIRRMLPKGWKVSA